MKNNQQHDPNEPPYVHHTLDSESTEGLEAVRSTDLDLISEQMIEDDEPLLESLLVEEVSLDPNDLDIINPDDVPLTDEGGLINRAEVFDEDSDNLPAGAMGHGGVDKDTD